VGLLKSALDGALDGSSPDRRLNGATGPQDRSGRGRWPRGFITGEFLLGAARVSFEQQLLLGPGLRKLLPAG